MASGLSNAKNGAAGHSAKEARPMPVDFKMNCQPFSGQLFLDSAA
jgi:hypothetical protein